MPEVLSHSQKVQKLRERVKAIKPNVPKDYKRKMCTLYPEYNTLQWADKMKGILLLRSTDELFIERLEKLVTDLNK